MPRGSSNPPRRPAETPANLRDKAARARRLAEGTDPKTQKELTAFARELETKATQLVPRIGEARRMSDPDQGFSNAVVVSLALTRGPLIAGTRTATDAGPPQNIRRTSRLRGKG
jgi:hypothetical protein